MRRLAWWWLRLRAGWLLWHQPCRHPIADLIWRGEIAALDRLVEELSDV